MESLSGPYVPLLIKSISDDCDTRKFCAETLWLIIERKTINTMEEIIDRIFCMTVDVSDTYT